MGWARTLTGLFALGRLAFGAGLLARPDRLASGWVGDDARRGGVKILTRAVGVRDVALSLGTLATLSEPAALRPWLAAAVLADVGDTASTLAAPAAALPGNARWGTVVLGGGSALVGTALLVAIER